MADQAATSKIKIKIGHVEIEYEGTHEFLREDFLLLLTRVVELRERLAADIGEPNATDAGRSNTQPTKLKSIVVGTVSAIAAKLQVESGPDLVIAAAAKLTFVDGKESFSRKELLDAMRSGPSYMKPSYSSNLSQALKTLLSDGRITEPSTDQIALMAAERAKLEPQLA